MPHTRTVNAPPRTINAIAADITAEWTPEKVDHIASPFLDAMRHVEQATDTYGVYTGEHLVRRFLSNASQFKGARARELKEELRAKLPRRR
jgi:hypothetical protein